MSSYAITAFAVIAVGFMMVMYARGRRHVNFVLAFAAGCILSSGYGFLSGAWPFGATRQRARLDELSIRLAPDRSIQADRHAWCTKRPKARVRPTRLT
jgi:hypothetical protein